MTFSIAKHKDSDPTDADSKKKSKPMSEDRYIQSHATDPHTVEKIWHFIQNYPDSYVDAVAYLRYTL